MTRRRLLPFIVLVMLLSSLVSTEAAEVWCRVAVGASVDADDDDGLYFTGSQCSAHSCSAASKVQQASVSAANNDAIVDEPTFSLPPFGIAVAPHVFPRLAFPAEAAAYTVDTRGPPAETVRFVRPPPRAPPIS